MAETKVSPSETVAGAGFIALDILYAGGEDWRVRQRAGGTCGNVLAILSFLGLQSFPIARLGTDRAADLILSDLQSVGVDCQFVHRDPCARTPRVVEFLPKKPGGPHRFAFICPKCQRRFPRRSEPTLDMAQRSIQAVNPGVFFFDRADSTTINLAVSCRERGSLVVFEPDSFVENSNFVDALQVSDVVKYSIQRTAQSLETRLPPSDIRPRLVVETMDGGGLRYSIRSQGLSDLSWRHQEPYFVETPADQAGAGDWCSAGLISHLLANRPSHQWQERTIRRALAFGQALAAASILFEGPRGYMEKVSPSAVLRGATSTLRKRRLPNWIFQDAAKPTKPCVPVEDFVDCPFCLVPAGG